jgi:nitrogen-specific signal transduction histidine kinase
MLAGGPPRRPGTSLGAEPPRMTPLRTLAQHPVPVVAVADDGAIVFANTAFADVLSCSCEAVASMSCEDICCFLPPDETLVAVARLGPNTIGRLLQLGEATLFVKMRRSAILSAADSGPVTLFEGLMKRLSRLAGGQDP